MVRESAIPWINHSIMEKCARLTNYLRSRLSRLSATAEYKKKGQFQKDFALKALIYMQLAEKDPKYREIFFHIIRDASISCGDRVSLSILHLGLAHRLATFDKHDVKGLADFLLKGVSAVGMLEQIARDKVPTFPFFDEIEVYLGYPVMLKQRLGLPIDVDEMLYFASSSLKPKDLDEAEQHVLSKQRDMKESSRFFINHPK